MIIKVKSVVKYAGHSIRANGMVNFNLKAAYDQLVNTIQLTQMLNCDITIKAKLVDKKPMKLGIFRIKQVQIDGDGESVMKFDGLNDYIEMNNLNMLPTKNEDGEDLFAVVMEAEIEEN